MSDSTGNLESRIPSVLYQAFKKLVSVAFNTLNIILGGNLPPFGCACVVVEKNQQYLVIDHAHGKYAFPGGFMRWSEKPTEAAKRECKEETGLDLQIVGVIGYRMFASHRFDRMSTLTIIYDGKVDEGPLRPSNEGTPYWVHEDELREKLDPLYRDILDDYFRYRTEHSQSKVIS